MPTKFKITGASEIEAVLKQLPKEIQAKPLTFALRKGANVIAEEAKRRVPVDSGELKDSIVVRAAKKSEQSRKQVVIGFTKPTSRRAHLTEFGTKNHPARPFMRPAIDAKGKEAINVIGAELGPAITRAAVRLAGPIAKSGLKRK